MSQTEAPDELSRALAENGIDLDRHLGELLGQLRRAGYVGDRLALLEHLLGHVLEAERWPVELDPRKVLSRSVASRMLGRSVQRIDQLRRRGILSGTRRPDGRVAVTRASVHARLASEAHGARMPRAG
jgi:hypothetical protein